MSATLRAALREATMPSHTAIEANPTLAQLTSSGLTEHAYRHILERYYGFFRAFEQVVSSAPAARYVVDDLEARFKTSDLRADLAGFGLNESAIEGLPVCRSLPPMQTVPEIFGAMYVVEGSALGGLLISKHLSSFAFYSKDRASFFHSEPKAVSERWKSFIARLESVPETDDETVISSAIATFEALDRWMAGDQ